VNNSAEEHRRQARRKQLKLLMALMLIFMVAGPLLGPKIFPAEFSQLKGVGLKIFYIGTPTIFGVIFLFYLFLYCRMGETAGKE
jgi:polyferredoxin